MFKKISSSVFRSLCPPLYRSPKSPLLCQIRLNSTFTSDTTKHSNNNNNTNNHASNRSYLVIGDKSKGVFVFPRVNYEYLLDMEYSLRPQRLPAGRVMEQLDLCAARTAKQVMNALHKATGVRYRSRSMGATNTKFVHPVYSGDMLQLHGYMVHAGGSSIGIYIRCYALNANRPEPVFIGESFFTMVIVETDAEGTVKAARVVPAVELRSELEVEMHHRFNEIQQNQKKLAAEAKQRSTAALSASLKEIETKENISKPNFKTIEQTRIRGTYLFQRMRLNNHGTVFGGEILSFMEKYAVHCGRMFTNNRHVYTIGMHTMTFADAVNPTDWLTIEARVVYVRNTTMEVNVTMRVERDPDYTIITTNRASFILISQTESGENLYIPTGLDWKAATPEDLELYVEAKERYERRRERLASHKKVEQTEEKE